jgi:hypothetical protein
VQHASNLGLQRKDGQRRWIFDATRKCFFEAPNFECGDVVRREAKLEPCAPTESGKAIADLVTQPDATSEMPENVNTRLKKILKCY